jgi:hypothetical protein
VLPSGVTEIGAFRARVVNASPGDSVDTVVSFPLALPKPLPITALDPGLSETSGPCTGTPTHPTAAPGNVCIYEAVEQDRAGSIVISDPGTTVGTADAPPYGVDLRFNANRGGDTYVYGTWAATAP